MDKMDLKKYGITGVTEIVYNPSYDELFREETKKGLRGYEKGQLTETGAVNVMTGVYTGRSPKDKFFVMDETTKDTIWWTSDEYKNDNKPVTKKAWKELKKIAVEELSGKKLFVVDTFCGANENSRLKIRFIMEVAWQAHFVKNMFIRPTDEELENYGEPDFVVLNASKAKVKNYKELGLNSETAVVFNLTEKMQVIINTWYGGEMKKGMFSYMNYLLPLKGMASMHCSANTNAEGRDRYLLRPVGHRQDHAFDRPEASADRRRRARLGRRRRIQLRGRLLRQGHQPLAGERARHLERHPPQRAAGERDGGQEGQDRLCRQVGNREHPRIVPDLPHREYRETRIEGPGCQEGASSFRPTHSACCPRFRS